MNTLAPVSPPDAGRGRCLLACIALLVAGAAAHLWFLVDHCPLDLSGDEAHYWEWARHLDFSYYSKGPLVAWIIAASRFFLADWSERLVGNEALAVRVPALLLSALTGLGVYVLAVAVTRRARLALAAVALTFTVPILVAGSMLMTIDAPLACAWTWALVCVERALRRDSTAAWMLEGLLIAAGILAKYTMVLLFPAVGLLILMQPELRRQLKRPGPYLATLIGLLGFAPILIWNAQHEWVSFRHVAGQAGLAGGTKFDPALVLEYVGGQFVAGLWLPGMILALAEYWRRARPAAHERHEAWAVWLLVSAGAIPWLVFLAFSPITKVQPNWPVLSLIASTILMAMWMSRRLQPTPGGARRWVRVYLAAGLLVNGLMAVVSHRSEWYLPLMQPLKRIFPSRPWESAPDAKWDLTARLRGWSELGRAVGKVVDEERAAGRDPFILADNYQLASLLAFYTPGEPLTYSAQSALGGRLSQYDLWPNPLGDPDQFLGRSCIYVGGLNLILTGEETGHAALPGLHEVKHIEYLVAGRFAVQSWQIFVAERFAGFERAEAGHQQKY